MHAYFPPWLNTALTVTQTSKPPFTIDDLISFQTQKAEPEIRLQGKKDVMKMLMVNGNLTINIQLYQNQLMAIALLMCMV